VADIRVFKREPWRDAAATLRRIADGIESGEYPKPEVCLVVMHSKADGVEVFGLGERCEGLPLLGALRLGEQRIIKSMMG